MSRPVRDRVFRLVLDRLVGDEIARYHYDPRFHADCFRKATEIAAALAVDGLLASDQ